MLREVVVLGVGMHPFGRFPDKQLWDLGRHAVLNALADAGIQWKEVEALYAGSMFGGSGVGNNILKELGLTGIRVANLEAACSSGPGAFSEAYLSIGSGLYDVAVAVGVEKQPRGMIPLANFPLWMRRTGLVHAPGFYSQEAQVHMKKYGTTVEQFAKVSVKSHKNASLSPYAHYQNFPNLTVEEVLNSRMICDPLTIYMMAPADDGGAAAVLCAKSVARRYTSKKCVTIASCMMGGGIYHRYTLQEPPRMMSQLARKAYEMAGMGPKEMDVVECQDAMASAEILSYETLGLCPEGEGGRMIDEGRTEIGGDIPVNTDGGYLSRGNAAGATGLAAIAEIAWQLRGEAGPRQVKGAKAGLNENFGAGPNGSITILKV